MTRKLGLTEKDKAIIARKQAKEQAKKDKEREKEKTRKAREKKSVITVKVKFTQKDVTVKTHSKREAQAIKKNEARLRKAQKDVKTIKSKIDEKTRKGIKLTKKEQEKYKAARKRVNKESNALHHKLFTADKRTTIITVHRTKKGGKIVTERSYQSTPEHKLSDSEYATVVIRTLTPLITESDQEIEMGGYTTLQLEPQNGKTIAELASMQMRPHILGDDFVVDRVSIIKATRHRK